MTRADVIAALHRRLDEIRKTLPKQMQRRATQQAHLAADELLRRADAERRERVDRWR